MSVHTTGRHRLIIRLIADGLTDHEIGRRLGITESTVRGLVLRIRAQYRAASRAHLVALAMRAGDVK